MDVSDSVLDHLRQVAALPDLSGTRYELESEIGRACIWHPAIYEQGFLAKYIAPVVLAPDS